MKSQRSDFGRVTYRVYLGYTAENDPVNDYDIERNVHYTYNVTIKGMNDLVVEAMSDKDREEDPLPGWKALYMTLTAPSVLTAIMNRA